MHQKFPAPEPTTNFWLRNLLIFNLSLSDLWLCLIAMPVTLTEIKVIINNSNIIVVVVISPSVDVLAMGGEPGDALQDPPPLHLCQVFLLNG